MPNLYAKSCAENQSVPEDYSALNRLTRGDPGQQHQQALARHLAGELRGQLNCDGDQISCPGPGHSDLDRSLSIKILPAPGGNIAFIDTLEGFIVHSFAGDDAMDCRDFVRDALQRAQTTIAEGRPPLPLAGPSSGPRSRNPAMSPERRWPRLQPAIGTLAEQYLNSRDLTLPPEVDSHIAFNPAASRTITGRGGALEFTSDPALAVAFRDIITGEISAIQQTFLTQDARKIERKFTAGSSPKGTAVKLDSRSLHPSRLYIGEGLETCLAARQLGMRPVWAVGPSNGIARFPVIDGVAELVILGENDSGASAKAVGECVARWQSAGRQTAVARPDAQYKDFNDALMGGHNGR